MTRSLSLSLSLSLSRLTQHRLAALRAPDVSHRSGCHPCSSTHTHTQASETYHVRENETPPRGHPPPNGRAGKLVRDRDGPIARAVVFSRPVRGFDSRELSLLGPLHVELSSGHCWNHPPLQQPAPPPVPADRVEVSSIFFRSWEHPPPKTKHIVAPHTCSSARRHRYSKGSMGGPTHRSAATGFEPAPSGLAPSAPPLGQRPP